MRKGEIALAPFPFTDLSGQKIRPALILAASKKGEDCNVAFISSLRARRSVFDIPVKSSRMNGLKVDSMIKVEKIATLQKQILLGSIGKLEPEILAEVDKKLTILFRL